MASAETLTAIPRNVIQDLPSQKTGEFCIVDFHLASDQAIDGLAEYLDRLRVGTLQVKVKVNQHPTNPACIRVEFALPISSMLESLDPASLKALNALVVSSE